MSFASSYRRRGYTVLYFSELRLMAITKSIARGPDFIKYGSLRLSAGKSQHTPS